MQDLDGKTPSYTNTAATFLKNIFKERLPIRSSTPVK